MTTVNDVLKKIKDNGVKYLDLRFTDPRGKLQHLTIDCSVVDEFPSVLLKSLYLFKISVDKLSKSVPLK